jgi:hypothetical protein
MINVLFPALNWLDAALKEVFPLVVRLVILGLVCGAMSILIYLALSNQERIAALKREGREIRSRLLSAEPNEFAKLVGRNTKVSGLLLGRVLLPSLISALPVIVVAAWLAIYHNYQVPADAVAVRANPPQQHTVIRVGDKAYGLPADGSPVEVSFRHAPVVLEVDGRAVYTGSLDPPVGSVTKRLWWSPLLENPSGYIDREAQVDEIQFSLPIKRVVPGVPNILAGWELPFFLSVFLSALGLKLLMRVH